MQKSAEFVCHYNRPILLSNLNKLYSRRENRPTYMQLHVEIPVNLEQTDKLTFCRVLRLIVYQRGCEFFCILFCYYRHCSVNRSYI